MGLYDQLTVAVLRQLITQRRIPITQLTRKSKVDLIAILLNDDFENENQEKHKPDETIPPEIEQNMGFKRSRSPPRSQDAVIDLVDISSDDDKPSPIIQPSNSQVQASSTSVTTSAPPSKRRNHTKDLHFIPENYLSHDEEEQPLNKKSTRSRKKRTSPSLSSQNIPSTVNATPSLIAADPQVPQTSEISEIDAMLLDMGKAATVDDAVSVNNTYESPAKKVSQSSKAEKSVHPFFKKQKVDPERVKESRSTSPKVSDPAPPQKPSSPVVHRSKQCALCHGTYSFHFVPCLDLVNRAKELGLRDALPEESSVLCPFCLPKEALDESLAYAEPTVKIEGEEKKVEKKSSNDLDTTGISVLTVTSLVKYGIPIRIALEKAKQYRRLDDARSAALAEMELQLENLLMNRAAIDSEYAAKVDNKKREKSAQELLSKGDIKPLLEEDAQIIPLISGHGLLLYSLGCSVLRCDIALQMYELLKVLKCAKKYFKRPAQVYVKQLFTEVGETLSEWERNIATEGVQILVHPRPSSKEMKSFLSHSSDSLATNSYPSKLKSLSHYVLDNSNTSFASEDTDNAVSHHVASHAPSKPNNIHPSHPIKTPAVASILAKDPSTDSNLRHNNETNYEVIDPTPATMDFMDVFSPDTVCARAPHSPATSPTVELQDPICRNNLDTPISTTVDLISPDVPLSGGLEVGNNPDKSSQELDYKEALKNREKNEIRDRIVSANDSSSNTSVLASTSFTKRNSCSVEQSAEIIKFYHELALQKVCSSTPKQGRSTRASVAKQNINQNNMKDKLVSIVVDLMAEEYVASNTATLDPPSHSIREQYSQKTLKYFQDLTAQIQSAMYDMPEEAGSVPELFLAAEKKASQQLALGDDTYAEFFNKSNSKQEDMKDESEDEELEITGVVKHQPIDPDNVIDLDD